MPLNKETKPNVKTRQIKIYVSRSFCIFYVFTLYSFQNEICNDFSKYYADDSFIKKTKKETVMSVMWML